ncbi:hypothetical protein CASFOL_015392 [Castilleja foliolosa]|uniref:Secreted protein n=1 Tax=Castilleja foliolosa TaxID=1961234 RepID=A0ABD3DF01_9LAMI
MMLATRSLMVTIISLLVMFDMVAGSRLITPPQLGSSPPRLFQSELPKVVEDDYVPKPPPHSGGATPAPVPHGPHVRC